MQVQHEWEGLCSLRLPSYHRNWNICHREGAWLILAFKMSLTVHYFAKRSKVVGSSGFGVFCCVRINLNMCFNYLVS